MAEKRIDPDDGTAYTYAELSQYYKKKRYKQWEIDEYWEKCYLAKPTAKKKAAAKKNDGNANPRDDNRKDAPIKRQSWIQTKASDDSKDAPKKRQSWVKKASVVFDHVFLKENTGNVDDFYDIEKGNIWGEGAFGQVVIGRMKGADSANARRAIKCIDKSKIADKERFQLEIDIQQKMSHVSIVRLYETFEDARMKYLVLELCEGDELFTYISEYDHFSEKHSSWCLSQILGAVNYIHSQSIVHRDIKPENILLATAWDDEEEYPKLKLIDFGAARHYQIGSGKLMKTMCGTIDYLSPQHVLGKGYDEKCDVWSCGVLVYQMLSGEVPFFAATDGEIKRKIREGQLKFPNDEWEEISSEAKDIIKSMLVYDNKKRSSASALLQNKWITESTTLSDRALPKNLYDRMKGFQAASKLKRVALTVIAQQICDDSDLDALKQAFQALDTDKDGFITAEEMVSVFQMEKPEEGKYNFPEHERVQLEDVVRSCNTSGSQKIDITEFIAATMGKQSYSREHVLWSAFRTFDSDRDGKISKQDLAELLGETDANSPTVDAIYAENKTIDADGKDVGIDFKEFQRVVESEAKSRRFTVNSITSSSLGSASRKSIVFSAVGESFSESGGDLPSKRKSFAELKAIS